MNVTSALSREYLQLEEDVEQLMKELDRILLDVNREDIATVNSLYDELEKLMDVLRTKPKPNDIQLSNSEKENKIQVNNSQHSEVDPLMQMKFIVRNDSRWFLKVNILGSVVYGMLDSGATHTYVNAKTYQNLLKLKLSTYAVKPEKVLMANGQMVIVDQVISVPMQVGSKGTLIPVRCLASLTEELLLGMDYISRMAMMIDTEEKSWHYKSEPDIKYPFISGDKMQELNRCNGIKTVSNEERTVVETLVAEARHMEPPGFRPTSLVQHKIELTSDIPVQVRPRPMNPMKQQILVSEVNKMLEAGFIRPSYSNYSNPTHIVDKKDENGKITGHRIVLDSRKLNDITKSFSYGFPQLNQILTSLNSCKFISKLDIEKAYFIIPLSPESCKYTAFQVPNLGTYEFVVMCFGLKNAPAEFQKFIDLVLGNELTNTIQKNFDISNNVFKYMDDIIVVSEDFDYHLTLLKEVFYRLRQASLKINWGKSEFCAKEIKYLGFIVDEYGVRTNPEKVRPILEYPAPRNVKEVRRVIGMLSWYRKFVPNFSDKIAPLTALLKKSSKFLWGSCEQKALDFIKEALTTAPILARPKWELGVFYLQTDASDFALGGVLTQRIPISSEVKDNDGLLRSSRNYTEHVIEYVSRTLSPAERNYSTTEKELLAVVHCLDVMRYFLENYKVIIITDHLALRWLHKLPVITNQRLCRWILKIQSYDITFIHRKGSLNYIPDALSRIELPKVPENSEPVHSQVNVLEIEDLNSYSLWYQVKLDEVNTKPETCPDYQIIAGQLYYHKFDNLELMNGDDYYSWKLVPKMEQIQTVLKENHDAEQSAHLGVIKTFKRIARSYFWPGYFQDVTKYVKNCRICQTCKPKTGKTPGFMIARNISSEPAKVFYSDIFGPLVRSSRQHQYVLIFACQMSKYVELVPLRVATAATISQAFIRVILSRYGKISALVTDNASNYNNHVFQQLAEQYQFQHKRIALYNPSANFVERNNRVLKSMIRCYVDKHNSWDQHLHQFQFAINSTTHASTGFTPNFLMYGRELEGIQCLRQSLEESYVNDVPQDMDYNHVGSKRFNMKELYELVRINQLKASQAQAKYYNKCHNINVQYNVGDLVLRRNFKLSSAAQHYSAKLAPTYVGPFRVVKRLAHTIYVLEDDRGHHFTYHIKDLRPYYSD